MPSIPPLCLAENNENPEGSVYSIEEAGDLDALTSPVPSEHTKKTSSAPLEPDSSQRHNRTKCTFCSRLTKIVTYHSRLGATCFAALFDARDGDN